MTKVIGCMNCGYRTEDKAEIDLFIANGCQCQALAKARAAVVDYLKGYNINDPEQVRAMAQLKNTVKELENQDTYCEECANETDTPCIPCQWEEVTK